MYSVLKEICAFPAAQKRIPAAIKQIDINFMIVKFMFDILRQMSVGIGAPQKTFDHRQGSGDHW